MCYAVFDVIVGLKRAPFDAICDALPCYARVSISEALRYLRSDLKLVELCRNGKGEYWKARAGAHELTGVRRVPTKSL